ncbi:phage antirepressor KilAC domain-containing protein [Enterococcus sp. DIV0086]|uniref:phage antirepressor KilAC domain-containing protein n=1 Tax=Enterococcus sp. DIV0086 TaxID=2774655 RepID=UPI003D285D25
MNELVRVTSNENDEQLVSARELHKSLELKTRFSQWVTQNFKLFRKNIDFTSVVSTAVVNNGALRELQDYALSVEIAKHIVMMTGAPKGFEVRDYISVEQAWNNPDVFVKRAVLIQQKKIDTLQLENQELRPKALFADAVDASKTSILIGDLAKLIKQNGVDIGQNRLFQWLRDNGCLIARKSESYNMPTQRSLELDIAEIKERTHNNPDGNIQISRTLKITGK